VKLPSPGLLRRCRKGIIFSGPLIAPILGRWKTVTRRMDLSWLSLEIGELLYVRESIVRDRELDFGDVQRARFAADRVLITRLDAWGWQRDHLPAIHMPRGLSRAVLRVTERVRREPLHAITELEARAEGVQPIADLGDEFGEEAYRRGFRAVWEQLHTKPGQRWNDDPALARIPFELVEE
jgi:hypothetical protein